MERKRVFLIISILVLFSMLLPYTGLAQGNASLNIDEIDYSQHPQARLMVTVRDENGVPIPNLQPADFEIVEDGRFSFPPVQVTPQFNPNAVISVILVLDISGSMKGKPLEELKRAANAFMDGLSDHDRVALIAFGEEINVDPAQIDPDKEHPFTHDKNAIRNTVNFLQAKGATPLYDALFKAVKMTAGEPEGKRAILLMTDGRDERIIGGKVVPDAGSRVARPDDPINEATRYHIPIFTIGLGKAIDRRYLQRLALRTGGTYQETPEPEQLTQLFQNILNILKHQYELSYESRLPKDDNPHSVLVRVKTPKGEAFAERKFRILEVPPVPTPTPSPTPGTPPPTPSNPIQKIINQVQDKLRENRTLALIIVGALALLFIVVVFIVVLIVRRREEYPPEEGYLPEEPVRPAPPTSPTPSIPQAPTVPPTPTPYGPTPSTSVVGTPEAPPMPGGTKVIRRVPAHTGLLIDKKDPSKKFDVGEVTNIGRSRNNDVILENVTVSRQHARIKLEGDSFVIYDLGSSNGTFVNGKRVVEPRRLKDGDIIRFGEVEMVFKKVT